MAIASNEAYYDLKPQNLEYYQPEYYKFATPEEVGINATGETAAPAKPVSEEIIAPRGNDHAETATGKAMKRDATNDFGYKDKPGLVGLMGSLPGVAGLAGKAVNLGWNASNNAAVKGARGMLGLEKQDTWGDLKGTLKDNHGVVSKNVGINGQDYQVGFEAVNNGRTNLTPTEANNRANLLGGMEERAAPADQEYDKGGLSGLFDSVGSFFDSLGSKFGTENKQENKENANVNTHLQAMGLGSFPDAPNPQAGDSKTNASKTDITKADGPWGAAKATTKASDKTSGSSKGGGFTDSSGKSWSGKGLY